MTILVYESRGKIHTPHRRHRASILTILTCCVHCCGPAPFRNRILHIIHSPALWSSGVASTFFTSVNFLRKRRWNRWVPFTTAGARRSRANDSNSLQKTEFKELKVHMLFPIHYVIMYSDTNL